MHHYIGLMSGTSVDGIDAVLVTVEDSGKINLRASLHGPFPPAIRSQIETLMLTGIDEIDRSGMLDMELGRLFADAALAILKQAGVSASTIRAIGSHGQTIRHRPDVHPPFTRQIGNPSVIAELTGITTVADFRVRDMAAGGQGAPLVPAFHNAVFRAAGRSRAVVNIGGIANITWLPGDPAAPVLGFDTGPGNTLLDQWIALNRKLQFDRDGEWAREGRIRVQLVESMLEDGYFEAPPPKSTGREHFNLDWLRRHLAGNENPQDVQATLVELTARSISAALHDLLPGQVDEVFICGGGARNPELLRRLREQMRNTPVQSTSAIGFEPEWIEAIAFAWLAHQTLSGQPGNLPAVTGARRSTVLGGIFLG